MLTDVMAGASASRHEGSGHSWPGAGWGGHKAPAVVSRDLIPHFGPK